MGAEVVGVSPDDYQTQCDFARSTGVSFALVADEKAEIAESYDVLWPLLKRVKRVTIVIDADGRVRGVFHNELRVQHHVRAVAQLVKRLTQPARATAV